MVGHPCGLKLMQLLKPDPVDKRARVGAVVESSATKLKILGSAVARALEYLELLFHYIWSGCVHILNMICRPGYNNNIV